MRKALFLVLLAVAGIAAQASAEPVRRRVMALYKSSEGDDAARNLTAALLEQPLESLGLVVDYVDADVGLPGDAEMSAYRGVVTYFRGPDIVDAAGYASWMRRQIAAGRKFVVFGEFGALRDRTTKAYLSHAELNAAFSRLGLRFDGFGSADPSLIKLVSASPAMSFEQPFTQKSATSFVMVRPLERAATAYLTLARTDLPEGVSTPVVATRAGGFASGGLLLYEYRQGEAQKQRWHLNPYAFLSDALGLANEPRFDGASLNGNRLWMAHIDGDGFLSPADPGRLCGQAMLEEVLAAYALPISVSMISDDLNRDARAAGIARRIFSLANVEPASHSASHPVDWTAREVDGPREVSESVKALNGKALPPGRSVRLITWSGLCNPTSAAIRMAESLGLANINGINADSGFVNRFDALYPSRTHLSPMTRNVNGMLQFNHRASNDYDLTARWSDEDRGGFLDVLETFRRTASGPERPAHVYFHFYSAHTPESLQSLMAVLDWSKKSALSRVFIGDYVRLVEDFRSARISRESDGRFRVRNAGACRTVVFPDADRHVDPARSENVIGYAARQGALYVFLDDANEHVIALSSQRPRALQLASASGWVDRWAADDAGASFELRAFGDAAIALSVPSDGYFRITVRALDAGAGAGAGEFSSIERAKDGRVAFRVPASGRDAVRVEPAQRPAAFADSLRYPMLALSLAFFPIWFFVRARRKLAE